MRRAAFRFTCTRRAPAAALMRKRPSSMSKSTRARSPVHQYETQPHSPPSPACGGGMGRGLPDLPRQDLPPPGASRITFASILFFAALCALASPAHAHGFGQRYDLPLPLSLYLFGAAAAVVLSFVIVGLFARHTPGARGHPQIDLPAQWLGHPIFLALLKLIAADVFILTVSAGFCVS